MQQVQSQPVQSQQGQSQQEQSQQGQSQTQEEQLISLIVSFRDKIRTICLQQKNREQQTATHEIEQQFEDECAKMDEFIAFF